ncbi:hypothetical protein GF357_05105 [Candidatus Dojkabacteria bacterium]|nr:hypothetical protein [Candidatus Dojkabacteria bacterium]
MSFFISDLRQHLITRLTQLKADYPDAYQIPAEMLSSSWVDFEPQGESSYISLLNAGEMREDFYTTHLYTVNTKVVYKSTQNIGGNIFSNICRAIYQTLLLTQNRQIGDYRISTVNLYDYTPVKLDNKSLQCEIVGDYSVDVIDITGDMLADKLNELEED